MRPVPERSTTELKRYPDIEFCNDTLHPNISGFRTGIRVVILGRYILNRASKPPLPP